MSALNLIPDRYKPFTRNMREDLRLIEFAEKLGYTVTFQDNSWHNDAQFQMGDTYIWTAGNLGTHPHIWWQAKDVIDGRFERDARFYGRGYAALWNALVTEAIRNAFKF